MTKEWVKDRIYFFLILHSYGIAFFPQNSLFKGTSINFRSFYKNNLKLDAYLRSFRLTFSFSWLVKDFRLRRLLIINR